MVTTTLERAYSIGKVSEATGCKVETIRFYEQIGLLPEPERTEGKQRRYLASHIDRLRFILHARDLGFSVEAVRELLKLAADPSAPCEQADEIARAQLAAVRAKIARLMDLAEELERVADGCHGGRIADCRVIEVLAEHGACSHGGARYDDGR
ncbi:MerR family transcriptional regulator [Chelatococcus asaccharovorans]|uniref:MerR family transcriptional regulator n=1 Tax=Chelatococcus asaccharovorans TaxID=28210 RepID=UPI00224C64FD|nr:helix-turn-helix domain-containing protein [Chelatococcus asaccharovorans]CAH1653872.1 Transcriptional regulator, MerR family [Chelatococcus asaccharovorans]CAH1685915.1 Transcriptional regulator, MerR family [Chelatococcus asaccharovorans]